MNVNQTPRYYANDRPTHCCARFNPKGWDRQRLRFKDKPFIKASTRSLFHIPLNMGGVFSRVQEAIGEHNALDPEHSLVLSEEASPWRGVHYFAVDRDVPGQDMERLSGEFFTRVFEGPFSKARQWCAEMEAEVAQQGRRMGRLFYFYTTCPKCSRAYESNYVVGVAELL